MGLRQPSCWPALAACGSLRLRPQLCHSALGRLVTQDIDAPDGTSQRWGALYEELRSVARSLMRRESGSHTLQTTALVHEAWLRFGRDDSMWTDRIHFLSVAGRAMRQVLVDHARGKGRVKRGGDVTTIALSDSVVSEAYGKTVDLLALDAALDKLEGHNPLGARIVELRFFAGMSHEEIATACGVSQRTVERNFRFARAHLFRDMSESRPCPS